MSQVSPTKTLDLKSAKPQGNVKKKAKGDEFKKELDEKKKSDRDQLSASHQNEVERRPSMKKDAQSSKEALRSKVQEQKANEKGTAVNAAQAGKVAEAQVPAPQGQNVQAPVVAEDAKATVQNAQAAAVQSAEADAAQMLMIQKMQAAQKSGQGVSLEGMTLVNPEMINVNLMQQQSTEAPAAPTATAEGAAAMTAVAGIDGKTASSDTQSSEGDLKDLKSDQLADALHSAIQAHTKDKGEFEGVLKTAATATPAAMEASRENNVNNMVQSASTLLREGGGEMKVVLTPEGMGTVDLKVGVQDNQVTIEIMTQDNNVKKMFEDGIADIRGALENQNLKIDHFKVDVSHRSDLNAGDQQQQDTANREFARDFMNQFRGERQGLRNMSMGYDMERSPNMSKSPEGLRPAQTNSAIGNGRLNVIA